MQRVNSAPAASTGTAPLARMAFTSGAATLFLLGALHVLSPEFKPATRMVSEYALGKFSWVLALMFLAWALSSAALVFALRLHVHTRGGKIGLGLLLLASLGMALAAVFDVRQGLHSLATLLGNPPFVLAALLISHSLGQNPAWHPAWRSLRVASQLPWVSLLVMLTAVFVGFSQTGGQSGSEMWIGWPNRLLVLAYCTWLVTTARWTARLGK